MNKNIDISQYIGMSQSIAIFGMYLPDHIEQYCGLHIITADMAVSASLERLSYQYAESLTNVGIAEQNMIGIAAGMASEGFKPICIAQASFISMRAFEMNRQYLGYMHSNIKLIGLNSGFLLQFMGNTHYCIEDLSIMQTIPNMVVLSPADAVEAVMALDAALRIDSPVYIRLTGNSMLPVVYKEPFCYQIGINHILKDGNDLAIFATGSMVGISLETSKILYTKYGIMAAVIDVHTIKPIDTEAINKYAGVKLFVSVEEHNIIGGLGSSIADYISQKGSYPLLLKLGICDVFSKPGDYNYLLEQHCLTPILLSEKIYQKYSSL
ncbi:transketolase family protein [Hoylesella marshii]|uniref:Transketolase, pyridine binding domain protein n=1 Tax=Hoylesella marshii DSM 16973 = JCM 13450 TaxID=862515 RepID=E0NTE1_9BACT|nr:transketolase C-terminal domain-containing protein [Hoylesella marshii]EFM01608.1 Transketolase, pyridine binding domain protein [Hoylesella marshii DSM 16973 = JCM 13450]